MTEPNLQDLLGLVSSRLRRGLDKETQQQRSKERTNRGATAASKATTALRRLHPDDYRSLYQQASEMVNAERGPLPGDEEPS
ncbi:MAG TPA: hypothetical protein VNJ54_08380 [Plantibacter sp.]|uniref:hypothetical protein n=1 Tax=Plantibacter sp. TaxID=1871045 RepID=UPI002B93F4F7|nr:hypothetical protein [Plantibacter sp.]